jgi:hypothetical protein
VNIVFGRRFYQNFAREPLFQTVYVNESNASRAIAGIDQRIRAKKFAFAETNSARVCFWVGFVFVFVVFDLNV